MNPRPVDMDLDAVPFGHCDICGVVLDSEDEYHSYVYPALCTDCNDNVGEHATSWHVPHTREWHYRIKLYIATIKSMSRPNS